MYAARSNAQERTYCDTGYAMHALKDMRCCYATIVLQYLLNINILVTMTSCFAGTFIVRDGGITPLPCNRNIVQSCSLPMQFTQMLHKFESAIISAT